MIVFPMAGLSSRFARAGFDRPKYMLEVAGRPLFWHAVAGFRRYFATHPLMFILRDVHGTADFVRRECARMGLRDPRIVVLEAPTSGQAETVALGLRQAGSDPDQPLTIFNIDTVRRHFAYPRQIDLESVDGYLEVFRGDGDHWSFARPDPRAAASNRVAEVAEKRRISDLCCTGLYHFRSAGLFLEAYDSTAGQDVSELQGGERYVAPLYNVLIRQGCDIRFDEIAPDQVAFSGTPEEYDAFCVAAPARPNTGAVITGRLRDIGEAFATFRQALKLREAGLLDEIVLSTWHGEIDQFPGLRRKLSGAGLTLVESDCPTTAIRPGAMWNAWLQAAALRRGMDALRNAECVLKIRTDKCAPLIPEFVPDLQDRPAPAGPFSALERMVSARLGRVSIPMHVNDIAYFGSRQDLSRMAARVTDGRLEFDAQNQWTGVETRWAAGPFFDAFALYRSYHATVDAFAAAAALSAWAQDPSLAPVPPGLARAIGLGWRFQADGIHLVNGRLAGLGRQPRVPVERYFHPDDDRAAQSRPSRRGLLRNFVNDDAVEAAAAGRFAGSPAAAVFASGLEALDRGAANEPLTSGEIREIADFLRACGQRDADVGRPIAVQRPNPAGRQDARADFTDEAALLALIRRSGAPGDHVDPIRKVVASLGRSRPGEGSYRIGLAYQQGACGLPRDRPLCDYWWRIGVELRHLPSMFAMAKSALAKHAPHSEEAKDLFERVSKGDMKESELVGILRKF